MSKVNKHVVPGTTGGWAVKNAGASRASKVFDTQAEAVKYGRAAAKKTHSELFVHGRDGTIKERNSYGSDPFPPRDKS
jgi:UDP-N-acetylenolpyruvoylglucosamine reductase